MFKGAREMNILIVGNGFDLAHGLKTNYSDFLKIVYDFGSPKCILADSSEKDSKHFCFTEENLLKTVYRSDIFKYMWSRLDENKGWIDFENELHEIVEGVCEFPRYLVESRTTQNGNNLRINYKLDSKWAQRVSPFMYTYIHHHIPVKNQVNRNIDKDGIVLKISNQITEFIELFRRYLCWIDDNKVPEVENLGLFSRLRIDRFLSFNYTTTGPNTYWDTWKLEPENICYVHGKVQADSQNHIVMGIGSDFYDTYKHADFLPFFKFYQCYKYKTDMSYLKWLPQEVQKKYYSNPGYDVDYSDEEKCNIYIYGHSLDPTDENILLPFFNYGPENLEVKIYIYYLNGSSLLEMEKNLVKILGREKFETYLRGENPKIQFRPVT